MASVYLAEDTLLEETEVAIKILSDIGEAMPEHRARFLQEVKLTRKIQHENVVRTFDYGQDGDLSFYSMEYLQGAPLSELMNRGAIDFEKCLSIATQLMRGIVAIHGVGVIHRDLKPSNIIVSDSGVVTITDFGIARGESSSVTLNPAQVLGTIAYIAPEVLSGNRASRAVDFYALGVVLYELLTGYLPFDEESPARLILQKVEQEPISISMYRADLPEWIGRGVMGLLGRDPVERMRAVRDFAKMLEARGYQEKTESLSRQLDDTIANSDLPRFSRWRRARLYLRRFTFGTVPVLLATLFSMLALPISTSELGERVEGRSLDELFRWRGSRSPSSDAVIVAIDEQSYTNLGVPFTSPWPRELHARLLDTLAEAGAKLVVFDVLFNDDDGQSGEDIELAMSMRRVPTVLGAALGMSHKATMQGSFLLEEMIRPANLFEEAAVGIGTVGLPVHAERVRRFMTQRSQVFPEVSSLAQAAVSAAGGRSEQPRERDLINFYGPARAIQTVSYETVIRDRDRLPQGIFKDSIVFVGLGLRSSTGPSQRDSFATPYDSATFGAELHATATLNILHRAWIRAVSPLAGSLAVLVIAGSIIWSLVALPGVAAVCAVGVISLGTLAAQLFLFMSQLYVPIATGILWGCFAGCVLRILSGAHHALYPGRRL